MKVLFIYISSRSFGTGHYKRVKSYKKMFEKSNINADSKNIIKVSTKKNLVSFKDNLKKYDFIIFDLSNKNLKRLKLHYNFLKQILRDKITKFGIIDSLGQDQIFNHKFFNFVNIPYFFLKNDFRKVKTKYFCGPQFLFDNQKFLKKKNKKLNNILITAGGSDLNDSILKIIKLIKKSLIFEKKIYILIGPFFSKEYIKKIKLFLKRNSFKAKFLKYKQKISQNLKNIDIVITSSGLTKYNMLNTNIPFIAYCENKFQSKLHKAFKMKNFCLTLENLKANHKNVSSINKFFLQSEYRDKLQKKRDKHLNKKNDIKNFFQYIKNEI